MRYYEIIAEDNSALEKRIISLKVPDLAFSTGPWKEDLVKLATYMSRVSAVYAAYITDFQNNGDSSKPVPYAKSFLNWYTHNRNNGNLTKREGGGQAPVLKTGDEIDSGNADHMNQALIIHFNNIINAAEGLKTYVPDNGFDYLIKVINQIKTTILQDVG